MDLCQVLKALLLFQLFSATGSAMLNAPVLQEERAGGHERPSKFSAAVTLRWRVRVILPRTGSRKLAFLL